MDEASVNADVGDEGDLTQRIPGKDKCSIAWRLRPERMTRGYAFKFL